jgi:hypothetical protein
MQRRAALPALLISPLTALLAAPAQVHASGELKPMDDALPLFALVDRLVEARPLTAAATGKLVGGSLTPNGPRSTEHVLIYEATGTPEFDRIELRLAGPKSKDNGQFLMLEVNARRCVQTATVLARYGREDDLDVPTPRQPADAPVYVTYHRDWGTLSFGFERTGMKCLRNVVLDIAAAK